GRVAQSDDAAWSTHPPQLCRRDFVPWCKHDAEGREDTVETSVLEGQLLGVTLDPLSVDTRVSGSPRGFLEEFGSQVEPDHTRALGGGPDRHVASARGHIEHLHPGAGSNHLHESIRHADHPRGEGPIVAGLPGPAVPLLELLDRLVHAPPPRGPRPIPYDPTG